VIEGPDVEIHLPPKPDYVALVRHVVGATARMGGLSPDAVENAKLAASEASTNAVVVTARAGSLGPVEVTANVEGDRIRLMVADRGRHGEHAEIVEEVEPSSLDFTFERGLSLPLIQGLADDVTLSEREGGGTVLTMTIVEGSAQA
jgi:anti-sigma regulatory factor (Ser/Thr protein kinase)